MSVRKLTTQPSLAVTRSQTVPQQNPTSEAWHTPQRWSSAPDASKAMATTLPIQRWPEQHAPGAWNINRTLRLILLLSGVWTLHMFDLSFTLHEAAKGHFVELNPVAALVLSSSFTGIVLYKFILLGGATAIFWWLREHAITERAGWLLLITGVMLIIRWQMYFDLAPDKPINYIQPLASGM